MRVKRKTGREGGGFIALPWVVLDSPAYQKLSYPAKALLFEIARQYCRDNNGRLLCSRNYLKSRGWTSSSVIQRAKDELLDAGFIFETVKGHRPNKASWYAVTWYTLDKIPGYEHGVEKAFVRGAYRKNDPLIPRGGTARASLAPADGTGNEPTVSPGGAMKRYCEDTSVPSGEHHLEMPSNDFHLRACIQEQTRYDTGAAQGF